MKISKNFKILATGATIVSFVVVSFTGILLFFHLENFSKEGVEELHEWLGMAFVIVSILHIIVNFKPFKKYFEGLKLYAICSVFVLSVIFVFVMRNEIKIEDRFIDRIMSQNLSEIKQILGTDEVAFDAFLRANKLEISQDISLKEFIQKSGIHEDEIFEALLN